ncbi:MAG: M28 family peptidase [candidate division Zixibacteria bacterium]|nr:M28 family peptidase [candidate division Zixibacteria bacterium]
MDRVKVLVEGVLLYSLFAISCIVGCGSSSIPEFNKDKAFNYLVKQCDFGPRVPNSEAHRLCGDYLFDRLSANADICYRQKFSYYDSLRGDTLRLTNLISSFNKDNTTHRVLLCAHWDCRPWADNDPDSSLHGRPVMGASDGASGVAALLEIADILKEKSPSIGVDIILFDGEDYGSSGAPDQWLLGSKYFAANIGSYRPTYVLLLDLIGDTDLNIHKEYYSQTYAGSLVSRIWAAAAIDSAKHFHPDIVHSVYDDHIPFLELGIPAAVIVDMDYKWWHTVEDTPDKCSAESLAEVGRVVLRLLYSPELE